jgi:hypothetical protein
MDLPILGGIILGTVLACSFTPVACGMMCRIYKVPMSISPCQTIMPSIIFTSISSTLAFVLAFGAEAERQS